MHLIGGRFERSFDDVLPRLVDLRRRVQDIDGEVDGSGVPTGDKEQVVGLRRAAQPVDLPGERLR